MRGNSCRRTSADSAASPCISPSTSSSGARCSISASAARIFCAAGELLLPGYFLLWIGLAAAAMGVVLWVDPTLGLLVQAVLFGLLAFASCIGYARWLRPRLERRAPGGERLNRR